MQSKLNNIILVGPMGSGKTTIGKRLSEVLSLDFFDSDHEIIDTTGVSIDHIFDVEGEEGFRVRETDVLKKLCNMPNIVLATGGGAILLKENRELMRQAGFVVYLSSSVDQILRRTAQSKTRPLLEKSTNRRETITNIVQARDPLYKDDASIIINTNRKKLNHVIDEIVKAL
jgi:shikimate kinase